MRVNFSQPVMHEAISGTRAKGSRELLVGAGGDINAGSKAELLTRILEIAQGIQSGEFNDTAEEIASTADRRATLEEAWADPSGQKFAELGSAIAAEVQDRVTRAGFARRLLNRGDVQQGSLVRVRVRTHNVTGVVANGPAQVVQQQVRDRYLLPSEFEIVVNISIEQREINQGSGDLLQEKFNDGQEHFLVEEDRVFKRLADVAAPIYNNIQYFSGAMSPANISSALNEVQLWQLPPTSLLLSGDLLPDLTTGSAFSTFVDPVSKLEVIQTGRLGTVLGLELITDGMREPNLKVLEPGEFYVTTIPTHLGAYTDRGPIQSQPRNNASDIVGRGWFMFESMSMAVANAKGVAKGQRL